jgi:hypothetical protein
LRLPVPLADKRKQQRDQAPYHRVRNSEKSLQQPPRSDSLPKPQSQENLPNSILKSTVPLKGKAGLLPCTLPLVLSRAKWGPYFTLEVVAFHQQIVIKKDEWQIISVTNTCIVHRDLFGRKGLCKSKIITV